MYINLKYHIASLAAVFLALGLGILIGSAMSGEDALLVHQQQLAGKIETRMYTLSQKNHSLQSKINLLEAENNIKSQFENQVLPVLVSQKLRGRSISVIATTGTDVPEGLLKTLELAGAEVKSVNYFYFNYVNEDELLKKLNWPGKDKNILLEKISQEVARSIIAGGTGIIKILESENLFRGDGSHGVNISDVILIGGSREKSDFNTGRLDTTMTKYFKSRGINVFGVEESGVLYSSMDQYHKMGLSTVDNIDTVAGQVSLVYAISGKQGHYGIKPTAKKLLPVLDCGVDVIAR